MNKKKNDQDQEIREFKSLHKLKRGTIIYIIIRSVSKSGLTRTMDFYLVKRGHLLNISPWFQAILQWGTSKDGAFKVHGTGMNMAWYAVHCFSSAVYRKKPGQTDYLKYKVL